MIELLLEAERALTVGLLDQAERLYRQVAERIRATRSPSWASPGSRSSAATSGGLPLARRALAIDPDNPMAQPHGRAGWREVMAGRGETADRTGPMRPSRRAPRPRSRPPRRRRSAARRRPRRPDPRRAADARPLDDDLRRSPMRVLVTGGAGYVGSVSRRGLLAAGHEVVVLDDLSTGHRAVGARRRRLESASYGDADALAATS